MPGIDHQGVVALTQALVRTPSEAGAAGLVAETMSRFGWTPVIEEAAPGRPNVLCVVDGGRSGPTLLFEGHTDVVTEGERDEWSCDPFGGAIAGGRLYGRGSADMKGGLAAMLHATAAIAADGPFPGRVMLAALADEEGMMLGAKDFVRRGHARDVDAAIVCEPEGGEVCVAQKGAIRVRVDSSGRMAHGAMPQHGHNPIPALAAFLIASNRVQDELQRENGEHPLLGWDYVTPTYVAAGLPQQVNVIPSAATASLDIRTTPPTDHARLLENLEAAAGEGVRLTLIDDRPPTETSVDHPVVQAVREAHRRVHAAESVIGGVPGATDGTILWRDAGVPIVTYGPGGKWIAHQVDEFVELDDLARSTEVLREAARLFLNGWSAGRG